MHLIAKPRRGGKTTELVQWAAKNPHRIILVATARDADVVRRLSDPRDPDTVATIDPRQVLSIERFARDGVEGRDRRTEIGIDNVDHVVRALLRTPYPIKVATITHPEWTGTERFRAEPAPVERAPEWISIELVARAAELVSEAFAEIRAVLGRDGGWIPGSLDEIRRRLMNELGDLAGGDQAADAVADRRDEITERSAAASRAAIEAAVKRRREAIAETPLDPRDPTARGRRATALATLDDLLDDLRRDRAKRR